MKDLTPHSRPRTLSIQPAVLREVYLHAIWAIPSLALPPSIGPSKFRSSQKLGDHENVRSLLTQDFGRSDDGADRVLDVLP